MSNLEENHIHIPYQDGKTMKDVYSTKIWNITNKESWKLVEQMNRKDLTKISNIANHYIQECRKARITEKFDEFNNFANLFTGRKDLKFTNYKDAQTFSCTFEMERLMNKVFEKDIDEMYDCYSECSTDGSSNILSLSFRSNCYKNCNKKLNQMSNSYYKKSVK